MPSRTTMHYGFLFVAAFRRLAMPERPRRDNAVRLYWNRLAVVAAIAGSFFASSRLLSSEPAVSQSFDGPDCRWQLSNTGVETRIFAHECIPGGARENSGAERIVAAAAGGQSMLFVCPIAPVAVIDELAVRIWVKASRPDVQLAARVALPRTRNPQERPTVIVRGATYNRPGQWQQLSLSDVPKLLAAQVRVMRSAPSVAVDPREAFIDAVVLVVPGDPHGVEVVTDELVVDGVLRAAAEGIQLAVYPAPATSAAAPGFDSRSETEESRRGPEVLNGSAPAARPSSVRLQGGLLLIDDKPFLPRVIQWQGEPLQFLAERGFNVVQIQTPPTAEQIADARRHALWFLGTPPHPDALARDGFGGPDDRVLAWWLDDEAIEADPNYGRRWAELVRERDPVVGRPVIIAPDFDWMTASKTADVFVARHPRFGQLAGPAFEQWLAGRSQVAKPGTPMWVCFSTQFSEAVGQQCDALGGLKRPPPSIDAGQIESLVRIACTRGIPGFVFLSNSALSETDAATRQRAATLELINRRLQLIEPWLAAGKVTGRIASSDPAWTGVVLHADRARLMIPIAAPEAQPTTEGTRPPDAAEIVFVVPGVPESCQVFALSSTAMRTLPVQRVAGGTRLTLRFEDDAFVLMTEDPQVIQRLRQRIDRDGVRVVRLERDRALQQALSIADTARRMDQLGYHNKSAVHAADVNAQLAQIEALIAGGRLEQASQVVASAHHALERAAAEQRRGVPTPTVFDSNPLSLSEEWVAEYAASQRAFNALRGGENLLYGGDFEDLGQMTYFGWQHFRGELPGIESRAELSTNEPRHGSYCLELHAAVAAPGQSPPAVAGAPLWVQSPPMPVTTGQWIEITGWVRIDAPVVGGDEGLQIIDSLGGPELSLDIRQTAGWQLFRMIRAVPQSTELRLTFALTGLGSVKLDAVMVRALQQPLARRLPAAMPAAQSTETATVKSSGPLFVVPQSR